MCPVVVRNGKNVYKWSTVQKLAWTVVVLTLWGSSVAVILNFYMSRSQDDGQTVPNAADDEAGPDVGPY